MLAKMVWKEGGSIGEYLQGMNTNLWEYWNSNILGVGATINLQGNSGWSKMNENFDDVFEALMNGHQWGMESTRGTGGTPAAATTLTESSSDDVLYLVWGGGGGGGEETREEGDEEEGGEY